MVVTSKHPKYCMVNPLDPIPWKERHHKGIVRDNI